MHILKHTAWLFSILFSMLVITACQSTQSVTVVNSNAATPYGSVSSSSTSIYRSSYSNVENFLNNQTPPVYYQPGYYPAGYNSWGYYQPVTYAPGFYQSGYYYSRY